MKNIGKNVSIKKNKRSGQCSVTIVSKEFKKKPGSFLFPSRRVVLTVGGISLAVLLAVGAVIVVLNSNSKQSGQSAKMAQAPAEPASVSMMSAMGQPTESASGTGEENVLPSAQMKTEPTLKLLPEYEAQISQSLIDLREAQDMTQEDTTEPSEVLPGYMALSEAIDQINAKFNEQIDAKIESVKANALFDNFQTEYTGDVEGDSNTVNNWADVLAVYAVTTNTELKGLTAIPETEMALLGSIYDSMNVVEVTAKTTKQKLPATSTEEIMPVTTLTACVNAESLTYEEGAQTQAFTDEQKQKLEDLMSPDYYAVFAQLLGIDYYDGLDADQLTAILSNLDEGTTGANIVQAALTRLGNPYSKGKRGTGCYVDCSYFAFWAYDQAGVVIPTSSVEQARYCYNNGCKVELESLQPGDLIFWSKRCHCGRWHEIHHSAIYLGDNKVIEASSSRGRVVIRELWEGDGWKIFMGARPYAH